MTFRDMTITETQARALAQADVNVALQMARRLPRLLRPHLADVVVYLQRLTNDRSGRTT